MLASGTHLLLTNPGFAHGQAPVARRVYARRRRVFCLSMPVAVGYRGDVHDGALYLH